MEPMLHRNVAPSAEVTWVPDRVPRETERSPGETQEFTRPGR